MKYWKTVVFGLSFILLGVGMGLSIQPLFAGEIVQNPWASITYTINENGSVLYQWLHTPLNEIDYVFIHDAKTGKVKRIKLEKQF
ncbi:MAG: hypothetical protein E3J72_20940 [Planctomycetota bacterium]|nr:MAG: hypothetical protein E3J72_20940 [Planctomycetota bacterium]